MIELLVKNLKFLKIRLSERVESMHISDYFSLSLE